MQETLCSWRPCVLLALGLTLGCGSSNIANQTPEALNGRLDAASALVDLGKRDDALVKVAEDAASAGLAEIVKKALSKVTDIGEKDAAAANCALKLAKAGKGPEATEVAKSITDLGKRDSVLSKLAKG
jgi:hypothetical protein